MQRNLTSTIAGAPTQGHKPSPVIVGGAAVILAAAAVVAGWQGVARRDGARTTVSDPVVAQVASNTVQGATVRPPSSELTVYLVGSQAEAARVLGVIAEGDRLLDQFGKPPFNAQAIVVTSAEEETAVMGATADTDAIRASMGLAPLAVIDLRAR